LLVSTSNLKRTYKYLSNRSKAITAIYKLLTAVSEFKKQKTKTLSITITRVLAFDLLIYKIYKLHLFIETLKPITIIKAFFKILYQFLDWGRIKKGHFRAFESKSEKIRDSWQIWETFGYVL